MRLALGAALVLVPLVAHAAAPGDLNRDGLYDVRDVVLFEGHLGGALSLDAEQQAAADVAPLVVSGAHGDGTVDVGDLVVLKRAVADPDLDGDGLSAVFEAAQGFSPFSADEDADGVLDGLDDADADGLRNQDEERHELDPHDADSDGDGFLDAIEFATTPSAAVATNASTATQFLFDETDTGNTPLQTEAEIEAIDAATLAVLRGMAKTRAGEPIAGVRVRVLGRPEFGTGTTRSDGMFDLAVNGGGVLTVTYDAPGFLSAQRKVDVPWQDYVLLPDVVLVPLDTTHTDVDLAAAPAIQVAQGSLSSDASGARRPTLLFRQGTIATVTLPDDSTTTLTNLRVRATEYTVGPSGPEAMPGDLPPQSAYTYAVEFTVDEARALDAKGVAFSLPGAAAPVDQYPVSAYLENFLDLPVGTPVPNGHYDPEKGAWLPEKSGVVLKVVGVTAGRADLDVTGDGVADATAALGITDDERAVLAGLYAVNDVLWWVPLAHFSDFNFAPSLPAAAKAPPTPVPNGETPKGPCESPNNSTIVCESQVLIEEIPVAETGFALAYASDRTPGYEAAYTLRFPLRDGATLPPEVQAVALDVSIAGRKYSYQYTPAQVNADGTEEIEWDGQDAYGRKLQGRQPVRAELRYDYAFGYQASARFGQAGNGTAIPNVAPRTRVSVRQPWFGFIGGWDARGAGLGGWTLSLHHTYDPYSRVLYLGNGRQRRAEQLPDVIDTVAGGGAQVSIPPEGMPATSYRFPGIYQGRPVAVAAAPDGSLFIGQDDSWSCLVLKVDRSGILTRYAYGSGDWDNEGIPATAARCTSIDGLAVAPDGTLFISSSADRRVRKVTPDGLIWNVAGHRNSSTTWNGDGIAARDANLALPQGITLAPDGSLYIAVANHQRVRRVDPAGTIWTVAGSGNGVLAGEDGPATEAKIGSPDAVAVDRAGNVYFSSHSYDRVWQIAPDGILRRFAGTGTSSEGGDGGQAIDASIMDPTGLAAGADGSVYISNAWDDGTTDHRVRRVAPNGVISTVAGTGPVGSTGDDGPARAALLNYPTDVAVAADGSVYVADLNGLRIRRIAPAFPGAAAGTISITSEDGSERYEFDGSGKHLATYETIRNTLLHTFEYDADDRLVAIADLDGNVTSIEHDAAGRPTAIEAPFGARTLLAADAAGWLESVTDPTGAIHALTTQPDGLLTAYTDPKQQTAHFEYGPYGYLAKDTDRAGGWKELARTESAGVSEVTLTTRLGRTTRFRTERTEPSGEEHRTITDAAGLATVQLRDAKDAVTITSPTGVVTAATPAPDFRFGLAAPFTGALSIKTPGGLAFARTQMRTGEMDETGVLTDQTDTAVVNGRTTTSTWDHDAAVGWNGGSLGRRTTTTAENRTIEEALDLRGRIVGTRAGTLHPTKLAYDTRGRIESVAQGPGTADRTTTFTYHPTTGRLASITDPASRVTTFDLYDAAGRVEQMTLPGSRVVSFDYDANGNLTSLAPPGKPAHVFRYTPVDAESEYEPPALAGIPDPRTHYAYDLDRKLDFVTRPDGETVDLAYEAGTGRLDTITIAEGVYDSAYFPLTPAPNDPDGQLQSIAAPGGQNLAFDWDGELPLSSTWSGPVSGTVSRTFDDDFRIATETVAGTSAINFGYDDDGLLTSAGGLSITRNGQGAGLVTATALGVVTTSETPNAYAELDADAASVGGASIYANTYTQRDALGRITAKTETLQGATTNYAYTYTHAGQLDVVTIGGTPVRGYDYDANGNRTHVNGALVGTYDAQDRLTSYQGTTYTYTAAGDLETKTDAAGTTTYAYDALGNLRTVVFQDGMRIEYVIDGQNRRIGKKICAAPCTGGATAQLQQGFLYADQLRIVAELDGSNQVASRFVYGTKAHVPDFMVKGGVTYRMLSDHLGSVRLVVNASTGAIAQRIDYGEWGNVLADSSPGFQPFGFAGGLTDGDTKLTRFGARDYDPRIGRWTSKDPIRFRAGDSNLLAYAMGDPINMIDPDGLQFFAVGTSGSAGGGWSRQVPGPAKAAGTGSYFNSSGDFGSYNTDEVGAALPGAALSVDFAFGSGDSPSGTSYGAALSVPMALGLVCTGGFSSGDSGWAVRLSIGPAVPPAVSGALTQSTTSATTDGNLFVNLNRSMGSWMSLRHAMPRN